MLIFTSSSFYYRGYGKRTIINSLEPSTEYKYRLRFMNDAGNSEWSAHVTVSTTSKSNMWQSRWMFKSYTQDSFCITLGVLLISGECFMF